MKTFNFFRRTFIGTAIITTAFLNVTAQDFPGASTDPGGWKTIWYDHFEGTELNSKNWNIEINADGGGNSELQYYGPEGIRVENSNLILTAKRESNMGREITSGRINSHNKIYFTHGKIEARIKLPYTEKGLWPAFWMLGENIDTHTWPRCGEIDILEMGNVEGWSPVNNPKRYFNGALHWGYYVNGGYPNYGRSSNADYDIQGDDYHTFTCIWDANSIAMYLDLDKYPNKDPYYKMDINGYDNDQAAGNYFHKPFHILFNLAVGGMFPQIYEVGGITAELPAQMLVDWVRISQPEGDDFYTFNQPFEEEETDDIFGNDPDTQLGKYGSQAVDDVTKKFTFDLSNTGDYVLISTSSEVTEMFGKKIRKNYNVDDTNHFFYIWENSYFYTTKEGKINSFGTNANWTSLSVGTAGWSGGAFISPDAGRDISMLVDEMEDYYLHFAMKGSDLDTHSSHTLTLGKAKFVIGNSGENILGDYKRDGRWYYFDIPVSALAEIAPDGSIFGDLDLTNYNENFFIFDSGAEYGTKLQIDNIFFYKKTKADFEGATDDEAGWETVWYDHFDGETLNEDNWNVEYREPDPNDPSVTNFEMQVYNEDGVSVSNSNLVIKASRTDDGGFNSGRINSAEKVYFTHGKIEARIKMPYTNAGLWPAFWMLGATFKSDDDWPMCGEIDIVETGNAGGIASGTSDKYMNGALHWGPSRGSHDYKAMDYDRHVIQDGDYHIFTCEWMEDYIKMSVDGEQYYYYDITKNDNIYTAPYYFHRPYHILFNLAVGGSFTGVTESNGITAQFPAEMLVDWVRISQPKNDSGFIFGGTITTDDNCGGSPNISQEPIDVPDPVHDAVKDNVKSLFSHKYNNAVSFRGDNWGSATSGSTINIGEKKAFKLSNLDYYGWQLEKNPGDYDGSLDVSDLTHVHFDYYTPDGTSLSFTPIAIAGERKIDNYQAEVPFKPATLKKGVWNSYDIPLSDFTNEYKDPYTSIQTVWQLKFADGGNSTGYVANVYFYKEGEMEKPDYLNQIPVPEHDAGFHNVVSILSGGHYEDESKTTDDSKYNTKLEVVQLSDINGNQKEAYHLTDFDFLDIILGDDANALNVSGQTHLHVDYFTTEGEYFSFTPIAVSSERVSDNSSAETHYRAHEQSQLVKGVWNSYDVPLSYFTNEYKPSGAANIKAKAPEVGSTIQNIKQLKFAGDTKDAYLANIYLYSLAGEGDSDEPTGSGCTVIDTAIDPNVQGSGHFKGAYTITSQTLYNGDILITASFNGDYEGFVNPQFWNQTNGFKETQMTNVGDGKYTITLSGYNTGDVITFQIKAIFAFSENNFGQAVTQLIDYTVGRNCQSVTTSADNLDISGDVTIYPNPADDKWFVRCNSAYGEVTLWSIDGKLSARTELVDGNAEVDASPVAPGVYLMHISTLNGTSTQRVVRK